MPLTDTHIRALRPSQRPYRKTDGGGLVLEVQPSGARLWRYRYRIAGRENMFAIGGYPEISLKAARDARDDARKLVRQGIHPAHQRKAERLRKIHENANTFRAVAEEWLAANKRHWTARTYRQRERLLERDIYPHVGALPMKKVTAAHGHAIVKQIEKRAPQMAVIAQQCFGAISRLAIVTQRSNTDIGFALRNSVRLAPTTHKRPLRTNEIPGFFKKLDSFPGQFQTTAAIRLLWFTLARPTEVIGAEWSEFDLENKIWTIPAKRMKMRQPHAIPLPDQAVELLETLKQVTGRSAYLIPNRSDPKRHAANTLLVKAFESMGFKGKFTPHAVRVTGRTILGEQGHPRDVLEKQLAHREAKHVRAYDQGDRLDARRVIMQGWADYLDGLCKGATVTAINAKSPANLRAGT